MQCCKACCFLFIIHPLKYSIKYILAKQVAQSPPGQLIWYALSAADIATRPSSSADCGGGVFRLRDRLSLTFQLLKHCKGPVRITSSPRAWIRRGGARNAAMNGLNYGAGGPGLAQQDPKVTLQNLDDERAEFILEGVDLR